MWCIHAVYGVPMENQRSLANLDLNLLVVLDVLLRERNVTRAAERIGLSQPAVSASLARLRRHFGDDLLARVGNRYQLTPLALRLAEITPFALDGVSRVFEAAPAFDPTTMEREFTVVTSDYACATLGPGLVQVAAEQAPGVRIRFQQTSPYTVDHAGDTLRTVDGIVLPHGFLTDWPHIDLYRDSWVCIVDAGNEEVGDELTTENLADLPWVILYDLPTAFAPSARQLRMTGIDLHVEVVVDLFSTMPSMVAGSRRIALLQARLAEKLAPLFDLRVLRAPFESVPLAEAFWWHPIYQADPGHRWLRSALQTAADRLTAAPPAIQAMDARPRGD